MKSPLTTDLTPEQRALLMLRLRRKAAEKGEEGPPPIRRAPREGDLPLSFAQQRLWFLDQLEPGSPLYNVPVALQVTGPLDAGRLARALGEVVRRHEALRTVFAVQNGEPVQVIQPPAPFPLPVVDLAGLPGLSLEVILGTLLRPLAWVMGVPWQDTQYVGSLIGIKTVLNEFVAYSRFAGDLSGGAVSLNPRSAVILAYALLGFANFSSIAIQIGGIGGLAPERRGEIARFGLRAMVAGNLAAFMSASWAGMLM